MKLNLFIFFLVFSLTPHLQAQDTGTLSLEDIYKNGVYGQRGFGPIRWMKDNKGCSTFENNDEAGGRDIVTYDAKSGKRVVLVSASQLIPSNEKSALNCANCGNHCRNRRSCSRNSRQMQHALLT